MVKAQKLLDRDLLSDSRVFSRIVAFVGGVLFLGILDNRDKLLLVFGARGDDRDIRSERRRCGGMRGRNRFGLCDEWKCAGEQDE
jgi:hypothetical protein